MASTFSILLQPVIEEVFLVAVWEPELHVCSGWILPGSSGGHWVHLSVMAADFLSRTGNLQNGVGLMLTGS